MIDTATVVQIIGGVAGFIIAIGALITSLRTNRRVKQTAEQKKREAADAAQIIVDAAAGQLIIIRDEADRARSLLRLEQEEANRWKHHCNMLEGKMQTLAKRVDQSDTCQSDLIKKMTEQQGKLDQLEFEKASLKARIVELESKIEALEDENRRLKEERDNEKQVIMDGR